MEPVARVTLLKQDIPAHPTGTVEVRRITLQPDVAGGPHRHNGPVFGSIERGSAWFQVDGGEPVLLATGDVFYEPADTRIDRFDATSEGVTFLGFFLTRSGQEPQLTPEARP